MHSIIFFIFLSSSIFAQINTENVIKRYERIKGIKDKTTSERLTDHELISLLKKNHTEDPTHVKSFQLHARLILNENYFKDDDHNRSKVLRAQKVLVQGLKAVPRSSGLYLDSAQLAYFLGDKETALKMMGHIKALGEITDTEDLVTLGRMLRRFGDKDKANATFDLALKFAKTNIEKRDAWFAIAFSSATDGENEKCVNSYDEVLKYDSVHVETHVNVIYCLIALARFDEAVNRSKAGRYMTSDKVMKIASADALLRRGYYHMNILLPVLAEADLKESLQFQQTSEAYGYLAMLLLRKKDYNMALANLFEGSKYFKSDVGEFYISFVKDFMVSPEHELQLMKKTLAQTKNMQSRLWAYYYIGDSLLRLGRNDEFSAHMAEALDFLKSVTPEEQKDTVVAEAVANVRSLEVQLSKIKQPEPDQKTVLKK